ncbi:MAG: acyl-CoA dehydrogenase family protein, partial [Methanomethylovorans sp.]|nr:acyl-CoA dehydrogenase family protein [Methanomethylovorans sp.]
MIRDESTLNLLVDTVSSFVKEKLLPIELEVSESDHIPEEIVEQMKELGMFGLSIPEEYDGIGLTFEEEVHVIMALCYASPVFRSIIGTNVGLGSIGIVLDGTEEQKKKYLPKIASGEYRASYALTEPDSGSDAASLRTTAKREGDYYIINGTKRFITNASEADLFTVFARSNPERKKHQGISAFLVERGTPGLIVGKPEKKMG